MNNQTFRKTGGNGSNFLWKMQMVHINRPRHGKNVADVNQKSASGRRYVHWISLVAIQI